MSLALTVNLLGDSSNLTRNTQRASKSLTQFEKASMAVSKRVNRTLGTIGSYFAFRNVARFLIESAKAAGEDQRGQKLLADQLKRTAGAKAQDIKATEDMISRMELATGVADDFLRPAMVKLVTVTRNTKKAQDLLKLALGASAKTGKPLEVTATAIAKAFAGQTTSLFRLLPNLKTSKDWMKDLADETRGLAAQQADPFEKMNRFFDRIKETVGGPLLERFNSFMSTLTDADYAGINKNVQGIATSMERLFAAVGKGDAKTGVLSIIEGITDTIRINLESITTTIQLLTGQEFGPTPGIEKFAQGVGAAFGFWTPNKGVGFSDPKWNPVGNAPAGGMAVNNYINIGTQTDGKEVTKAIDLELRRRGLIPMFGGR